MPVTLEALSRLIGHRDYRNPRDPDYQRRQRIVREGFEQLYPKTDGSNVVVDYREQTPSSPDGERQETINQLKERWEEVLQEHRDLLSDFAYPVPDSVEQRKRELDAERRDLELELEKYGESPGQQIRLGPSPGM